MYLLTRNRYTWEIPALPTYIVHPGRTIREFSQRMYEHKLSQPLAVLEGTDASFLKGLFGSFCIVGLGPLYSSTLEYPVKRKNPVSWVAALLGLGIE
jgi:hypothetical protein